MSTVSVKTVHSVQHDHHVRTRKCKLPFLCSSECRFPICRAEHLALRGSIVSVPSDFIYIYKLDRCVECGPSNAVADWLPALIDSCPGL